MAFSIVTDTSANLPDDILCGGVTVIPFPCFVEGEQPFSTAAFDGKKFYDLMRAGARVSTAQINPQQYADAFAPLLDQGRDVLFVGMSSGISGSLQSARLAAEELCQRYPERSLELVDTLGASLGEGLVVMRAIELRQQGLPLAETAKELREMAGRIYQVFTVDDLRYLRQGGRLSNAAAVIGSVLQIKPILKGNEQGEIVAVDKVRGREKAIAALAERYTRLVRNPSLQTVGIAHADDPLGAAKLAGLLRRNRPPRRVLTVCYEPVTGSHVGPGAIALFFESEPGARSR